jgi:hypothetical protein
MATNENGNLLDDAGNVVVDFVWGNFPLQPNDVREENGGELLDPDLDNHQIAYEGWNGYPLFTRPGLAGAEGAGYVVVPSVLGLTTAVATNILEDKGLVVTATTATNAAKNITRTTVSSATVAIISASGANSAYPVGTKLTISAGTPAAEAPVNVPAALVGTWTVTAVGSGNVTIAGTGFVVADTTGINATGTLVGTVGTIKTQSVAAGADEKSVGDAISIVAHAAAS